MISFRPIEESDFPLLLDWLQRPHVKEWWDDGDDTAEKVLQHYTSDSGTTFRFIILFGGSQAIGYIQYYLEPDGIVGIDLFIGEPALLNRGLGTVAIIAFVERIEEELHPKKIVIDPEPDNHRAIRCYEKAGFVFDSIGIGESGKQAYYMFMNKKL